MQIYLDTANLEEIRQGARMGILSGVTTNPSLVAKEGNIDMKTAVQEITSLVNGPISVEVVAMDTEGMVREGRIVAQWSPHVVVKLPLTPDGLGAARQLKADGIPTNVTLVFSVGQGLLAARAGATYVSPFVGRLDDIATDGMAIVRDLAEIYDIHGIETQIIAASIRHPIHALEAAKAGAHIGTMPFKVIQQMTQHPLTTQGLEKFMADWGNRSGWK